MLRKYLHTVLGYSHIKSDARLRFGWELKVNLGFISFFYILTFICTLHRLWDFYTLERRRMVIVVYAHSSVWPFRQCLGKIFAMYTISFNFQRMVKHNRNICPSTLWSLAQRSRPHLGVKARLRGHFLQWWWFYHPLLFSPNEKFKVISEVSIITIQKLCFNTARLCTLFSALT